MGENGLSIEAKMAAIGQQSPGLSAERVRKTAEQEVASGRAIEGVVDFGVRWYPVESESTEQMHAWTEEIKRVEESLQRAIDSGDLTKFIEESRGSIKAEEVLEMVGNIKQQVEESGLVFDEEAKHLVAVDLWIRREQGGKWKKGTLFNTAQKILSGKGSKIADALNSENAPNCIDVSFLIKALGNQFGIDGKVNQVPSGTPGIDHRYFQTVSGKILDYWWLSKSGGLALNNEQYQKLLKQRAVERHARTKKGPK